MRYSTRPNPYRFFLTRERKTAENVPIREPVFLSTRNGDCRAETVQNLSPWWFRMDIAKKRETCSVQRVLLQM